MRLLRFTLRGGLTAGAFLCAIAAGACSSNPTGADDRGIRVVAAPAADSALALPQQALVVEVRDSSGKIRSGVTVYFEASPVRYQGILVPNVLLAPPGGGFAPTTSATTDAAGRAAVFVRLGPVAGEAQVNVSVPTLGFTGTATLPILPGAPARLRVLPADSAVYVGRSFALRGALIDRWGNTVPGQPAVSFSLEAPGVVSLAGSTLTGQAVGRARIRAQADAFVDSAFVSVVPQGTLLAARGDGIYAFGIDGSDFRRVITAQGARSPRWFPDGQQFVYSVGLSHGFVGNLNGSSRFLLADRTGLEAQLWAHPSRDGQWVYFGGYGGIGFRGYPYRVRADGTGRALIPGFTSDDFTQGHPSPSPTGDRVAYFREVGTSRDVVVRVRSLVTGELLAPDISGHQPEWSHGDSIAFLDTQGNDHGPIKLMASDGSGIRTVGSEFQRYHFGIDWSPDDRWIVARAAEGNRLQLIEVATGKTIPLGYTSGLYDPTWRP